MQVIPFIRPGGTDSDGMELGRSPEPGVEVMSNDFQRSVSLGVESYLLRRPAPSLGLDLEYLDPRLILGAVGQHASAKLDSHLGKTFSYIVSEMSITMLTSRYTNLHH